MTNFFSGKSKPYVDRKDFFVEAKAPPAAKASLADLAAQQQQQRQQQFMAAPVVASAQQSPPQQQQQQPSGDLLDSFLG